MLGSLEISSRGSAFKDYANLGPIPELIAPVSHGVMRDESVRAFVI